ncbi:hypothetical protein GWK47_006461 [Chionoecetes opilio]|uniref:Uncharacterized protein n=1 Tax=Chionoecetes opilio TaxID=41210 RepID=A0A8J5CTI5_CHIOP|nr:hypothetical protein GWK47_006461 [Chionoecetes opilio]
MGVGITLVVRGLVLEGDKLRQVMRPGGTQGPTPPVLGKMRGHLVTASWMASPRDLLGECGFPLGDRWVEMLPMVVDSKERLACLERQTLARYHPPHEKGSEAVPLPVPSMTEEAASEARSRGQQDDPPLQDTAASQEFKHTKVEEAGEQVFPLQERDPVRDQNSRESHIAADAGEDEEANMPGAAKSPGASTLHGAAADTGPGSITSTTPGRLILRPHPRGCSTTKAAHERRHKPSAGVLRRPQKLVGGMANTRGCHTSTLLHRNGVTVSTTEFPRRCRPRGDGSLYTLDNKIDGNYCCLLS